MYHKKRKRKGKRIKKIIKRVKMRKEKWRNGERKSMIKRERNKVREDIK